MKTFTVTFEMPEMVYQGMELDMEDLTTMEGGLNILVDTDTAQSIMAICVAYWLDRQKQTAKLLKDHEIFESPLAGNSDNDRL